MKRLGVIGGFGPKATANFYMEVILKCRQKNKEERPPILVYNVPVNYQIEKEFLENEDRKIAYLSYLIEAAEILEKAGVDLLAIPCNAIHVFFTQIAETVNIPLLNIIEETAEVLIKEGYKHVGLLATSTTLYAGCYSSVFNKHQIEQVIPDNTKQKKLDEVINNMLNNVYLKSNEKFVFNLIGQLIQNSAQGIVIGCTELHEIARKYDSSVEIFDSIEILADAAANAIFQN